MEGAGSAVVRQARGSLARVHVVGMGEVGRRLASALAAAGVEVAPVTREQGWEGLDADRDGAVLVCVREEALPALVPRLAVVAPERLAVVANGWIRPLLAGFPGCTRGLIWFTAKSGFFRELRPSVFSGPLARPLAAALERGGIAAVAADEPAFLGAEAEKMGFNCVVGLPLAAHGVSLAEYLATRREEAEAVFGEAAGVTARTLGVPASAAWWPAFLRSAEPIGWVKASGAKALEYRNAAVVRLARGLGARAPVNERLLAAIGALA